MTSESWHDDRANPGLPILGVGVVALREGRVLLVRRTKPPRQGQWSLPGGRLEWGETLEAAVRRETREETGLELVRLAPLTVVDTIVRERSPAVLYHYVLVDFVAEAAAGDPLAGDDVDAARFCEGDEIRRLGIWDKTLQVITQGRTALARPAP